MGVKYQISKTFDTFDYIFFSSFNLNFSCLEITGKGICTLQRHKRLVLHVGQYGIYHSVRHDSVVPNGITLATVLMLVAACLRDSKSVLQ